MKNKKNWFDTPRPNLFEEKAEIKVTKIKRTAIKAALVTAAFIFVIMLVLHMTNPVMATGKKYLDALKNSEMGVATEIASGTAGQNMLKNKDSFDAYKASVMDYKIIDHQGSRDYGTVDAVVETKTNNNTDVNWYRLYIAKENTEMYVVKVENIPPVLTSKSLTFSDKEKTALKNTFQAYLKNLGSKNWDGAKSYLAGQALTSFTASQQYLQKADLVKNVTAPRMELIWKNRKMAVAGYYYKVSDRLVSVIVTFYKTQDGWRIVNVADA